LKIDDAQTLNDEVFICAGMIADKQYDDPGKSVATAEDISDA
jgi:hypothetical protein